MHATSSNKIGAVPRPKYALVRAIAPIIYTLFYSIIHTWSLNSHPFLVIIPEVENPSCLQTTRASDELQKSSQTVPHLPLTQTSTRPSRAEVPPTSLISPCVQPVRYPY